MCKKIFHINGIIDLKTTDKLIKINYSQKLSIIQEVSQTLNANVQIQKWVQRCIVINVLCVLCHVYKFSFQITQ